MPKQAAEPIELTMAQFAAIRAWELASQQLDAAKKAELANRLAVINDAKLPFTAKEEGGQTIALNAGYRLALKRTINYTVENDPAKINATLTELFAVAPEAAPHLIVWKPELKESIYNKLGEEGKRIVAQILTTKPGTPQLELKAPSEPKK